MDERKSVGEEGEDLACRFLEKRNQVILSRNWRAGHLELDIVTMGDDGIHFVEVKTRRPPVQLDPQDCVTLPKQRKMARAATCYLNKVRIPGANNAECHFDVVAVTLEHEQTKIEYFPDAFYPMYI